MPPEANPGSPPAPAAHRPLPGRETVIKPPAGAPSRQLQGARSPGPWWGPQRELQLLWGGERTLQDGTKQVYSCEYPKQSLLFLYHCLLIQSFSIGATTINLLLSCPVLQARKSPRSLVALGSIPCPPLGKLLKSPGSVCTCFPYLQVECAVECRVHLLREPFSAHFAKGTTGVRPWGYKDVIPWP